MSNDINEIIKRKEKLIDLLNKLIATIRCEKIQMKSRNWIQ